MFVQDGPPGAHPVIYKAFSKHAPHLNFQYIPSFWNRLQYIHFGKKLPIDQIKRSKIIGISSGASAPEQLVQALIREIKINCDVSIEEVIVAEEKVVFKLPKELN